MQQEGAPAHPRKFYNLCSGRTNLAGEILLADSLPASTEPGFVAYYPLKSKIHPSLMKHSFSTDVCAMVV